MCLIVGLGNPGKKYEHTRHNVGFLVLDELIELSGGKFKNRCEVQGLLAETKINKRQVELLKPSTFMNLSGEAVKAAASKKRVPKNKITIILDDVNLPLGAIRIRESGSAGGHNGLKSIIEKMKTDQVRRIRLGIGRPEHAEQPLDKWVLEKFKKEEWKIIVEAARLVAKKIASGEIAID